MMNIFKKYYIWIVNGEEYIHEEGLFLGGDNEPEKEIKISRKNFRSYERYCPSAVKELQSKKKRSFTATLKIKYKKYLSDIKGIILD